MKKSLYPTKYYCINISDDDIYITEFIGLSLWEYKYETKLESLRKYPLARKHFIEAIIELTDVKSYDEANKIVKYILGEGSKNL